MISCEGSRLRRSSIVKVGARFGRLLVTSEGERKGEAYFCDVLCACGSIKTVRKSDLVAGRTNSCGCLRKEVLTEVRSRSRKHGLNGHPLFRVWRMMICRCHNKRAVQFKYYGARGIQVCQRWQDSFEDFVNDMGPRPTGCQLGRINPAGDYEPGNVVWQDSRTQKLERMIRTEGYIPRMIVWRGQYFRISEIAAMAGMTYGKTYRLLIKKNLLVEDIINSKNSMSS